MFEKEAEEYVRKIRHDVNNWGGKEPEERFYNEIKFKQAYLAGAEFGYNKANEWHYPSKGEYPKEVEMKKQLTKAKEIIKKFSEFVNNDVEFDSEHPQEHTDLWNELCEQAERFISEVEK